MKKFLIIVMILISLNIYSDGDFPVMLKVKSNFEIKPYIVEIFRSGAEESLTSTGYVLISKQQQEEALKEQAKQKKSDCYDDACLVDTGKMMAARMIFITDINKTEENYLFKIRLLDLETGSVKRTVVRLYKGKFSDIDNLLKFSKSLTNEVLKTKVVPKTEAEAKSWHKLKFRSEPKGAFVYVDDIYVGKTPLNTDVEKGEHKFRLSLTDYNVVSYKQNIKANESKDLKLVPKIYTIKVKSSQSNVKVYYKDKYLGEAPTNIKVTSKDLFEKIILKKTGFYVYSHKIIRENLDKDLNINLIELEKYNLTINTKPKSAKIYLNNQEFGKIELKSGESKKLYKGLYSLELIKKAYALPNSFDRYIDLSSNKELKAKMLKNTLKVLRTSFISDITLAKDLKYLSTGLSFEIFNLINDNREITLLGLSLYKNIADEYLYLDAFVNVKWEVVSGLSLGLNASGILSNDFQTLAGSLLIEYKYMITNALFIKANLKAGLSYFDETNADNLDMLFMVSGISIGFNGFGE